MSDKPIRVSHVAVPGTLSVLKLKSHLRTTIGNLAAEGPKDEILLVKVLVPRALGLKAGERFFDKVLQQIVGDDKRVRRVSVEFVDGDITPAVIAASEARVQAEVAQYGHLLQDADDASQ